MMMAGGMGMGMPGRGMTRRGGFPGQRRGPRGDRRQQQQQQHSGHGQSMHTFVDNSRNTGGSQMHAPIIQPDGSYVDPATGAPIAPGSSAVGVQQAAEPLAAKALASATEEERKNMIGERLFSLIHASQPALAGKITGMLLDGMDTSELLHLLESPDSLIAR